MVNDPEQGIPICRFRKERSIAEGEDAFEEVPTPTDLLGDTISRRTEEVCGTGDAVSKTPLILRVQYAYCTNLTIWDMPGS